MTDTEQRRSPRKRYDRRVPQNLSAATLEERIIASDTQALTHTYEQIAATESARQAAALVLKSRRRFIAGEGTSSAFALLLATELSATLSNIHLIESHALSPLVALTDVRATDVLLLFSMRPYRSMMVRLAREFHGSGGTVVIVTDSAQAPTAKFADRLIVVNTGTSPFIDSPTPIAAVTHLLGTLISASAKGARRRLNERDRMAARLELYEPVHESARDDSPSTKPTV
nr:SIS domain-containing protein [Pseudoclavibacter sp. Marseille-Q3772]